MYIYMWVLQYIFIHRYIHIYVGVYACTNSRTGNVDSTRHIFVFHAGKISQNSAP